MSNQSGLTFTHCAVTAAASGHGHDHSHPRRREVVLWQRVTYPDRLTGLFTRDLPQQVQQPGTWMHDALQVRDDWESRLLRTSRWSPLQ